MRTKRMSDDRQNSQPNAGVPRLGRRSFLGRCAAGGAGLAAAGLHQRLALAAALEGGGPLAPRPGHFAARAERLIFVFLTGGFSHVDTFDFKPQLAVDQDKLVSAVNLRDAGTQPLLASPFQFTPRGQSGLWISELFPKLGDLADDLCVVRSLHTDIVEHFQATLAMHTGSATVPLPSIGCWLSYALGTHNSNLPSFVVLAEHLPYAGAQVWANNFLPPDHQGVRVVPGDEPVADLRSPARSSTLDELAARMLRTLNDRHAAARAEDANLPARDHSFAVARGLMREAPEAFDAARESAATLTAYGIEPGDNRSFAWQCLMARRLAERGVRVVELIDTGSHDNWDAHGDMQAHRPKAQRVDQPLAALLGDLKDRGMFDSTLVVICTEFGRTPWTDAKGTKGRNHFARAFSSLLAGGGIRGGMAYGETNEHGTAIAADACHVHDFHATILHLLGLDHERLTYRFAGRDFRLTDVDGHVLRRVIS
ncbi:MAG: DUF1501 domain-containing protein [Pirellulales bacterium]